MYPTVKRANAEAQINSAHSPAICQDRVSMT
jgi:hypothetical protein